MKNKLLALVIVLALALSLTGCSNWIGGEKTVTGNVPPLEELGVSEEKASGAFSICPGYTVEHYVPGKDTVELTFTVSSNLPFSSEAIIRFVQPLDFQLDKNPGYYRWGTFTRYCYILNDDLLVPAYGTKDITIRLQVPDYLPEEIEMPSKFMFFVAYQLSGHRWGSYTMTPKGNFVFYPSCLDTDIVDNLQHFEWLTWGNAPEIIVRAQYNTPPTDIDEGYLVYQGTGEQVIREWYYPEGDKILDRQYTLFSIYDNQAMPAEGSNKLFYRMWQKHLKDNVWDGTWDLKGQSLVVPEVQVKVLVSKTSK